MKNLKINISTMLMVICVLFLLTSCKKDKDPMLEDFVKMGTFSYQSKSMDIRMADYRSGNGDGAWIYLMTSDFNALQIRFSGLADYVIPTGTFTLKNTSPYNPATNFKGGFIEINNVDDELISGTVVVKKNGNTYLITVNATTNKGAVIGNFEGPLDKI